MITCTTVVYLTIKSALIVQAKPYWDLRRPDFEANFTAPGTANKTWEEKQTEEKANTSVTSKATTLEDNGGNRSNNNSQSQQSAWLARLR